ncbi:MAG: NosD domain-containing protein [Candidatus Bathyarchaeia archaeon]
MFRKTAAEILLFLLLANMLMFAFKIELTEGWTGTVYVRADGRIDPADAPMSTVDNETYTLKDDIIGNANGIVIERNNIVVDGAGYALEGTGASDSRGVDLTGRNNVTLKNLTIKQFSYGINLENSSNNTISGNNITNNNVGVRLCYSSNYNLIFGNNITNNSDVGLLLQISENYNQIFYNEINENRWGIWLWYSSFNNIWGNNITANARGIILFHYSSNNALYMNHIEDNVQYGLSISSDCASNTIYHNNFVNNTCQMYSGAVNRWDDGYPSGGNYWSNYNGVDLYSGPYQNETGSDGIGDEPYVIDENNQDRYPLMNPITLSLPWRDWTHYHSYNELVSTIFHLYMTYPEIVDAFPIGKSWQGRSIYCIKLTNERITNPKPKLLFIGYHHAREPISAELPLYFAVDAATNFGINETITRMLNYSEIYIIPALNVDGFDAVKLNEWQRKNVHPYDEDGDGLLDEDPPDDEDGDGYIENLFFRNETHSWFIRVEGFDDDGDGLYNEDWIGGVDLNRNYNWDEFYALGSPNPWDETYRGPEPFSEPETQAIRDFTLQHYFQYAISFHSGAASIGCPEGYTEEESRKFIEIAANLSDLVGVPWYFAGQLGFPTGFWDDWIYPNISKFPFTCEIYGNESAWQYEPGPEPDTYWEKGITQVFNPEPTQIMAVIERWLPVFTYLANRAIVEASKVRNSNTLLGYMSIQEAIDASETLDGHTIMVGAGTYYEHVTVNKAVSLVGENPATTIIDGGGFGTVINITTSNVSITGFTIRNGGEGVLDAGICLDNVDNCSITRNYITANNNFGIFIYNSYNSIVSENNIAGNDWFGIDLEASSNNTFSGNIFVEDGLVIYNSYGNIVADNLVNGKPLVYLEGASNMTVIDAGQVILVNCNHIIVENLNLSNTDIGIQLSMTNDTIIANNIITNNNIGVQFEASYNNIVSKNNIANYLVGCALFNSKQNTVSENTIKDNGDGVLLYNSSDNLFYHNNFVDNFAHVRLYVNSYNIWDYGYPSGGNYWSDYGGVDYYSGAYQNETGMDAIGDNQYFIDPSNADRYPLMNTWPTHDLAIINVVPSSLSVKRGDYLTINVTVINQGDFVETFNLTVYANTTVIGTETITDLPIRTSATFSFTWNTAGFTTSNYIISAYATPIQDETDAGDNIYVDGTVTIEEIDVIHDIAISNITFSKQNPSVNETIFVYVTVENRGNFTETFDVSLNYTLLFDPLIGTKTVTLEPGGLVTLNFTWTPNATGRYEIKAYTNEITEDINPSDNTKITYLYASAAYTSDFSTEVTDWLYMNLRSVRFRYLAYPLTLQIL